MTLRRMDGVGGGDPAGGESVDGSGASNEAGQMAARILLVDDNEDSRTVYRLILEHGGYEVLEAATGPDALTRARENQPDLILMDISIPVLDGWEATRILKADERTRRIPVIALTAHALETDRARAVEVGCDGYLAKPAAPTLVMATIQSRLGLPGTITT